SIDRVKQIVNTTTSFIQEHKPLDYFLNEKKQMEVKKTTVKILTPNNSPHYINWDRNSYGSLSVKTLIDKVVLTFDITTYLLYISHLFLMYSVEADIVEPPELKQLVADLLKKAIEKL